MGTQHKGFFQMRAVGIFVAQNLEVPIGFDIILLPLILGRREHQRVVGQRTGRVIHPDGFQTLERIALGVKPGT